jgi:hypothetical protein
MEFGLSVIVAGAEAEAPAASSGEAAKERRSARRSGFQQLAPAWRDRHLFVPFFAGRAWSTEGRRAYAANDASTTSRLAGASVPFLQTSRQQQNVTCEMIYYLLSTPLPIKVKGFSREKSP